MQNMMEEIDYFGAPYAPIDGHPEYSQAIEQDCSSGVIPQDATVIGAPTEDGKRRILVSEVTTINKPFFDRNKAMMTRYINTQLQNGNMRRIVPFSFTTKRINWLQRDYKCVNFWKVDRTHFIADVEVHLKLDTRDGVREWVGVMTLWGDIENGCACTIEDLVDKQEFEKRELVALSCFLIPIYSNKQMDKEMERLWRRYHPEALTDPSVRSAYELAKRMGLSIIRLPVYNHNATPSILFFVEDTILVKEAKSNRKEKPQEVHVPANTIVVNTNHRFSDYSVYFIYHECVHYEEHYMFFKLQEMHTNDIMRMKTKVQIVEADEKITSPLYWMEVQANRGAYGLMLPAAHTEAMIRDELDKIKRFRHPGDKYEIAGTEIARKLNLPNFRVRARMIQLGHIFAKGALNKVGGSYINPFCFDLDAWRSEEHTYVIDERTVKAIYEKSKDFRSFIDSGKYIYADGHVVRNTPDCVENVSGVVRLTPKANLHVNRCCLRFVRRYEQMNLEKYVYGRMYYDADYVTQTNFYIDEELVNFNHDEVKAKLQYKKNFPRDFSVAFHKLRNRNGMSMDDVAEVLGTSARNLERWIANPGEKISADTVTKLTLLWKLPDWLSDLMYDRAFIRLSETDDRCNLIQEIRRVYWMDGIPKADQFLVSHGQSPLS
ncbi:MAG: hypothetical protein IKO52_06435 [Clostridia bacterium]|nr:hypothetical protein [Clostridia bacterium]